MSASIFNNQDMKMKKQKKNSRRKEYRKMKNPLHALPPGCLQGGTLSVRSMSGSIFRDGDMEDNGCMPCLQGGTLSARSSARSTREDDIPTRSMADILGSDNVRLQVKLVNPACARPCAHLVTKGQCESKKDEQLPSACNTLVASEFALFFSP